MGKGTDKLYITHSEWASEDAFGASAGAGTRSRDPRTVGFRRLPFNFCALSLQPFRNPMCTADGGAVFDLVSIVPWIRQHGTNPVDGRPLATADLIRLNFARNDDGDYVDPVTFKVFTDSSHIAALRPSGNVFAYDTIDRLNIKAKMWRDLLTDQEFTRKDIIVLQDPHNLDARNLSAFKHLKDGGKNASVPLDDPDRIARAKQAVADARAKRDAAAAAAGGKSVVKAALSKTGGASDQTTQAKKLKQDNVAQWTTGKAAASFTSTGFTPHTAADRAVLSEEDYLLKPKTVKNRGYARIDTTHGPLTIELLPEFAPKAVWNFVHLAKKGYYNGISFHRNIRGFMIQGGDPTGTGKGGSSIWGKNFADEFDGPQSHEARGVVSMANKGKNTNGSQFFVTYRQCKHLDRKHTMFGRVVEEKSLETLDRLERVEVDDASKRPRTTCAMDEVTVLLDPFEEYRRQRGEQEDRERDEAERRARGGADDDHTTWTGKRIRDDGTVDPGSAAAAGVGKYLSKAGGKDGGENDDEIIEEWEEEVVEEPVRKKAKAGGFGNFDSW